jgi:sarcosine oxidase, subunit gamma
VTAEVISVVSPLAGWREQFAGLPRAVQVREIPFLTQVDVRVAAGGPAAAAAAEVLGVTPPAAPCTAAAAGGLQVLWLGPDEWLVLGPPGSADQLLGDLQVALVGAGSACDVSAQRATLSITGPRAADLLAHGCAIDLDPRAAPAGTCVQTNLARAGVILLLRNGSASDLWLLVRSSFAGYLAAWLVDACQEYRDDASWQ